MSFLTLRMKRSMEKMTTKEMALSQVRQGMTATVHRLLSNGSIRRRLLDMGLIQQPFRRIYGLFSARHSGGIKAPGCGPDTCVCSAKGAGGNAENGNHGRNDINKEGEMHGTYIRFNRAQRSGQRPGH